MKNSQVKISEKTLENTLDEASWLLSHAEALADYGRHVEAAAELARAANCEEQVACWLDAAGREQEAVVHRVSAASCYEKLGQNVRAVTLLRAALSATLTHEYRQKLEKQLSRCLRMAQKEMRQTPPHVTRKEFAVVG